MDVIKNTYPGRTQVIYFAHTMSQYDTIFEKECLHVIEARFFYDGRNYEIMNPNQQWLSNLYLNRIASGDKNSFEIFREIVRSCDITIGVKFFDGTLGSGVAEECRVAREAKKQVLIMDKNHNFLDFYDLDNYTVLSRDVTRQRKVDGIL